MLKPHVLLAIGLMVFAGVNGARAQDLDFKSTGAPLKPAPVDREIALALSKVSAEKIQRNIETLVNFKYRMATSSMDTDLPPGTGILAAAAYIKGQFEAISKDCGGCLEVKEDEFIQPGSDSPRSRIARDTKLINVYAILRGTDPAQAQRMYLVTGHYDTRTSNMNDTHSFAPGANDDTSGTAVSMECARVLSKHRFPATIVFATVDAEEEGLFGSAHLAKLAKNEGWNLEGVLNNDIVGGNTTPGDTHQSKTLVRVFSASVPLNATVEEMRRLILYGNEDDSPARELAREILSVARTYLPPTLLKPVMEMRLDRYGRGGDQQSFDEQGFPAVRFTEWREDYHHQHQDVRVENGIQYGDLLQYDDFNYIAKVARLNAATLATMASAPGSPKDVTMAARSQNNNSVIKFTAPEGAPVGTWYQVVWRETDASDWQYGANASNYNDTIEGTTHTITVPISKDNVFFGIRSCDSKGHCSTAVAPAPEFPSRNGPRPGIPRS
jgi:Peptidase family M28